MNSTVRKIASIKHWHWVILAPLFGVVGLIGPFVLAAILQAQAFVVIIVFLMAGVPLFMSIWWLVSAVEITAHAMSAGFWPRFWLVFVRFCYGAQLFFATYFFVAFGFTGGDTATSPPPEDSVAEWILYIDALGADFYLGHILLSLSILGLFAGSAFASVWLEKGLHNNIRNTSVLGNFIGFLIPVVGIWFLQPKVNGMVDYLEGTNDDDDFWEE